MAADKSLPHSESDTIQSAAEWIGVGAEEREKVIRELLDLSDALRPWPSRRLSLPDKVTSTHRSLAEAEIPHAIGGAVAFGYYGEPRSTLDIDVNVFVAARCWPAVRAALDPLDIDLEAEEDLRQVDEVRLDWDPNSLHLFFSCDPLHEEMRQRVRRVPFNGDAIPIVSPEHLVIRKALLDRTKDWLDIEQIFVATDPLDLGEIEDWLARMVGEDNPRMQKLAEVKAELSLD
ncbi:MAG TPA: hypothetical protein VFY69_11350 [Solirubrobacterales bacterium]|nr:hypothetical protein [Solirubrobacterales bacterium]